ncbi:hypothetical protein D0Z08_03040 [Nocardioides immobilis]|uniref:Allene oxide cyclase n=1 Tax=Nocardioides immobilis TaxID=2049295 RepID=A0A417Y8C9_9ACTN|nr:hypothetical protein [Nocardioides immobilis]RHW28835.1 hypothetical protein D0Z08_03040 [Nocardioides immobilis]
MNKTTAFLAGAAVLAVAATGALTVHPSSVSATDEPADSTTLTFRIAPRGAEDKYIDIGRKGETVGDRFIGALTLRADGAIAGRLQNECVVLDRTYEGHLCTMAILLDGGSITLAGGGVNKAIPNIDGRDGDVFAVTGGTGDYQGADGQLTVSDDGRRITITLVP